MRLAQSWAGRVFGTNIGNVYIKFSEDESVLNGLLHFNDSEKGFVVYKISGKFDGLNLSIEGFRSNENIDNISSILYIECKINQKGEMVGEWKLNLGGAGTIHLFPHNINNDVAPDNNPPAQLHTARHNFGAVELDREQILNLAEEIQRDFKTGILVVTVVAGTERSMFLPDFRRRKFEREEILILKLSIQEPEQDGLNKIIQVEFGPNVNTSMTQGGDEAWVLGMLERIKIWIRPYERAYTTNFKKFGFGINQILVVGAVVFLPSLSNFRDRIILICGVLSIVFIVNFLHRKYLPFAAIYLAPRPVGLLSRLAPNAVSWIIAATAGIAATLLAAYLQALGGSQ